MEIIFVCCLVIILNKSYILSDTKSERYVIHKYAGSAEAILKWFFRLFKMLHLLKKLQIIFLCDDTPLSLSLYIYHLLYAWPNLSIWKSSQN